MKIVFISLIEKAMAGELSLQELYDTIPNPNCLSDVFKKIFTDLEDAVEHYPASIWSNKPLHTQFLNSNMYDNLKRDLSMLIENE
jgi:hypothetical protein